MVGEPETSAGGSHEGWHLAAVEAGDLQRRTGKPRVTINNLPEELLKMIILQVVESETDEFEFSVGGRLVAWDHHNHAARLALVARAWSRPAQSVLYRSISLRGAHQATLFARTARARSDLAVTVRRLSIGLGDRLEAALPECGQTDATRLLVEAAELLTNVRHLHFRPLAVASHAALTRVLIARRLESIVVAPRAANPEAMLWHTGMSRTSNFAIPALSCLRLMEVDIYCFPPPHHGTMLRECRAFRYEPLQIRVLKMDSDIPTVWLLKLISAAGPKLDVLDIYHEQAVDVNDAYEALLPATKTLLRLRWRMNPFLDSDDSDDDGTLSPVPSDTDLVDTAFSYRSNSTASEHLSVTTPAPADTRPLFNRLLPRFERLQRLQTSTDALLPTLIGVRLPPTLKHIEIESFEGETEYSQAEQLEALKEEAAVPVGQGDVNLTLVGNRTLWTEEELTSFSELMSRRGVKFRYRDAMEEEGNDDEDGGSIGGR